MTAYERMTLQATALAALATGTPVTTHTEGVHGDLQFDVLCSPGVPAARIVVSHDCVVCYRGIVDRRAQRRPAGFLDFEHRIVPMLRERGLDGSDIDRLLVANPHRFFSS